jgi:hypothetical protein
MRLDEMCSRLPAGSVVSRHRAPASAVALRLDAGHMAARGTGMARRPGVPGLVPVLSGAPADRRAG